jgi:hypothetical protein
MPIQIRLAEHANPQLRVAAAALQPDTQDERSGPFRTAVLPSAGHVLMMPARRHRSVTTPAEAADFGRTAPNMSSPASPWRDQADPQIAVRPECCQHARIPRRDVPVTGGSPLSRRRLRRAARPRAGRTVGPRSAGASTNGPMTLHCPRASVSGRAHSGDAEDKTRDPMLSPDLSIQTLALLTKSWGAKRGANDRRFMATSGHMRPLTEPSSGTPGHAWHHLATLRKCLLSL